MRKNIGLDTNSATPITGELEILSIELPEIEILSGQMDNVLRAKVIEGVLVDNYVNLQKFKFFNAAAVKSVNDWLGRMRFKSASGSISNTFSTWSNISRC